MPPVSSTKEDTPHSASKKRGRDTPEVPAQVMAQMSPDRRVSIPPATLDATTVANNDNVSSSFGGAVARGRSGGGGGKYRTTSNGIGTSSSSVVANTLSPAKSTGPSPSKRDLPPKQPKSKDIQSYFRPRNDDDDVMIVNGPDTNEIVQRADRLEREKQDLQVV